jgi:hypothetical protein
MAEPTWNVAPTVIRDFARARVAERSLRWIAQEIGISPYCLRVFLNDAAEPQHRTRNRLWRWYARQGAASGGPRLEQLKAGLELLVSDFAEGEERDRARRALLGELVRFREEHELLVPDALRLLLARSAEA